MCTPASPCHPKRITDSITCSLQLHSINLVTATNNSKHKYPVIGEDIRLQRIRDVSHFSFQRACIPHHHDPLNSICHLTTSVVVPALDNSFFCIQSSKNINAWKYRCNSNRLGPDIACISIDVILCVTPKIYAYCSICLPTEHTAYLLSTNCPRNMY